MGKHGVDRKISDEELGRRISEGRKKAYADRKTFQEAFEMILRRRMNGVDDSGKPKTMIDSLCESVIDKVLATGDVKGFESIRDTVGEKPVDKTEVESKVTVMQAVEVDGTELVLNIGDSLN